MAMPLFDKKYEYLKDLGSGGFGKVFLAQEKISKRRVAIKELKRNSIQEQTAIVHEIEALSKLEHPNIVHYYHHFWKGKKLFIVMEYCPGGNLRQKIFMGKIRDTQAISWIEDLASCLRYVHQKGIVHHDIKPENILFSEKGTIKISDFGIANKNGGTLSYSCPESFLPQVDTSKDVKSDIYSLGVTLMELLMGYNVFHGLSLKEILDVHFKGNFPFRHLPNWQQEIILKAINSTPQLRFQFMVEFEEALKARSVPSLFKKENIKAAELVRLAEKAINSNKWRKALNYLELAENKYFDNISVLRTLGIYALKTQQIDKAQIYFDEALKINRRLDIQKELGTIHLEKGRYSLAIGLLTDHLHRHPSDFEAYNLLVRSYYETNRFDEAMSLCKLLMQTNRHFPCFKNNFYISYALKNNGNSIYPASTLKVDKNPFLGYNYSVLSEKKPSYEVRNTLELKTKLLFMDFGFNNFKHNHLTFLDSNVPDQPTGTTGKAIITFGREGYDQNDFQIPGGNSISRRHCLIVNAKDNVWIYDLNSTGTFLDEVRVINKAPVIGLNTLRINNFEIKLTTDRTKLL